MNHSDMNLRTIPSLALREMLVNVTAFDQSLDDAGRAPDGDDYNQLLLIVDQAHGKLRMFDAVNYWRPRGIWFRLRYIIGRFFMHTGLRCMPEGRGRSELEEILWAWGRLVRTSIQTN